MNTPPPAASRSRLWRIVLVIVLLLAGLPLAVWLDLRNLSEATLRRHAQDLNGVINGMRGFYATEVVARVLGAAEKTQVIHNYQDVRGAIPIPATLSLELARIINTEQPDTNYRFISDYPFTSRKSHALDQFEIDALARLRADPKQVITDVSWSNLTNTVRLVSPVLMGGACVACHNSHVESAKKDWKVGDVRGIQEIIVVQPLFSNIFVFKYLMGYFLLIGAAGLWFLALQARQAAAVRGANRELEANNDFLASISLKISRYISPQIYKSIFSGQKDSAIHTERKKLSIFFSDIKDFTATTERMQPEEITALLNEYFTAMSEIAMQHGGTIDKFIGDALSVFFGDPETKGVPEDAKACLRMAMAMQKRLRELNGKWAGEGVEHPFQVRMGINTGFCNVGNFGSNDRMDYTIIGAEANLAARLQSTAEAGQVVVSYETFALVRDIAEGRALAPISMKGISREVVPYLIDRLKDEASAQPHVFAEQSDAMAFYIDVSKLAPEEAARARAKLKEAMAALDVRAAQI